MLYSSYGVPRACGYMQVCYYSTVASFPGPTSQTIGKAGGGLGTFWHVTDVKLRRHGRGFPLAKRCSNARLRDRAQKSERRRVLDQDVI